ncbi:hypothetical protein [Haloplanus halobius]|uniref:hypothetical protein n=1 Tax=Haloplanus halobius TaxID=2934938 RepID=UPI00200CD95B|nr:hypothetical protein [Haloplanus sp. XH21]
MAIGKFVWRNKWWILIYLIAIPALTLLTRLNHVPSQYLLATIPLLAILGQYNTIQEKFETYKKNRRIERRQKKFDKILRKFEDRFEDSILNFEGAEPSENLIDYCDGVFPEEYEQYLHIFYVYLAEEAEFDLNHFERNSLDDSIISFCRGFDLRNPTDETVQTAWGIHSVLCTTSTEISFDNASADVFDYDCLDERFIRKYVEKERLISELTSERQEIRNYKQTLSTLYQNGKLNEFGIKQILSGFENEIKTARTDKTHFLILMNQLQHDSDIQSKIEDSVKSDGGSTYSIYLRISNSYYSSFLAVVDGDEDISEFYETHVEPYYQETEADGWLSVHKAKFEGSILERRYEETQPSDNAKKAIARTNILAEGQEVVKLNLEDKLIESYLSTDELLTVLPLNLFLPDLSSEKRETLIQNNEDIKEEFNISKLTDWANPNYPPSEIADYLQRTYFPEDSQQEWEQNVQTVVQRANEVNQALTA